MARYDLLVKDGTLVLPYVGTVRADLAVRDGKIVSIGDDLDPAAADEVLSAQGGWSSPGPSTPTTTWASTATWRSTPPRRPAPRWSAA
ncbi:hypothetical protein ACFQZ4_12135 [Catellatospora coxensis]